MSNNTLMRVLVACDKFKGSLSALEACEAVKAGLMASGVDAEFELCPIADGGEGFVTAMIGALRGEWVECKVSDALGRKIVANYGVCRVGEDEVAVMEMAEAAGMWRLAPGERKVMKASTAGVGQMIRHAAKVREVDRILIGLGGSATNDGGVGMAAALGIAFRDAKGWELEPVPEEMIKVAQIGEAGRIGLPRIEVACDVDNPLLGPTGATAVFGPQKGAGSEDQEKLEQFLTALVETTQGEEIAERPGAGAAGGLGFGLMRFAGGELRNGFDIVADHLGLEERFKGVDVVVTGEGSLDEQSLSGKGPVGVARLARQAGAKVVGIAGKVSPEVVASGLFDELGSLEAYELPLEESMARGAELLRKTGEHLAGLLREQVPG
jgi:glycerate kinase